MKTNPILSLRNRRHLVTTARAQIERQHSLLSKQQPHLLRLALNEAEALAWETGLPQLVFPTLAVEKIHDLAEWNERQTHVLRREPILSHAE